MTFVVVVVQDQLAMGCVLHVLAIYGDGQGSAGFKVAPESP